MPNLDFHAADDDRRLVLDALFALGLFRVFETSSEPGRPLREFATPDAVTGDFLELYAIGSGPEPVIDRSGPHEEVQGWGLIQLYFGHPDPSHTSHNTEKRAQAWAAIEPELGDPAAWDWPAVTRASAALNRAIRRLAVAREGSHPILPGAAAGQAKPDVVDA